MDTTAETSVQASVVLAASQYGPVGAQETKLCEQASHFDWPYLGGLVLADGGLVTLDVLTIQSSTSAGVRMLGPGFIGLFWGWTVGSVYLTLPHCSRDYVGSPPIEGSQRSQWPLALGFGLLATATAPVLVGIESGQGNAWPVGERAMRLVVAGAAGAVGAMVPYVLPPSPWRARLRLDRLRAGAISHGAVIGYSFEL